jgi:hypothetical protein
VAISLQSRRGEEGLPKTEIGAREIEKALLVSGVSVSIMLTCKVKSQMTQEG